MVLCLTLRLLMSCVSRTPTCIMFHVFQEQLLTHNQVACICGGFLQLDSQAPPHTLSLPNFKEKVGENGMKRSQGLRY